MGYGLHATSEKDVYDMQPVSPREPATPVDARSIRSARSGTMTPRYPSMPTRPTSTYTRGRSEYRSDYGGDFRPQPASRQSEYSMKAVEDPVMAAKVIARRATLLGWFDEPNVPEDSDGLGATCVAIKEYEGQYAFVPSMHDLTPSLSAAITRLDDQAIISLSSEVTSTIIDTIAPEQRTFIIDHTGARIPIVPSLDAVHSGLVLTSRSCIVLKEKVVIVWSNEAANIINVAHEVEKQFLEMLTDQEIANLHRSHLSGTGVASYYRGSAHPSRSPSLVRGALDEKNEIYMKAVAMEEGNEEDNEDLESALPTRKKPMLHTIKISLAIMLVIITQGLGVVKLLREYAWDGGYMRFLLCITIPPLALFSFFFFIVLVNSCFQLFLPATICLQNTKSHSAIKPNPKRHKDYELPHITIQMPVYKEGLKGVIVPTMVSIMQAIEYYEQQGGTASVFVNDDGMQLIKPELAQARQQYYRENGIGYTARLPNKKGSSSKPKQKGGKLSWLIKKDPNVDEEVDANPDDSSPQEMANRLGFERKGKFKKASNMNYGLRFSNRVEDELERLARIECQKRGCRFEDLTIDDDEDLYEQALQNMLTEDKGMTWAEGNIRIGEIILIIDCDTRVPEDSLLYGALEMHESPEVAIIQHGSGVMQVVHNTFENGITYFTNIVYTAIKYGVGTGDVSPFVGHNAFLRWQAIQSIEYTEDGVPKWWSESHVSEDFDISLRLQMAGYIMRLATYHNGGFKEGVSLTLYDELTRWEKYAYGCNELVFHPFYQWIYRGPVTRLFLRFLWSNMPVTSKINIIAYIFTYYAIGSGMFLTVVNYIATGLFPDEIDHYWQESWGIWMSLVVVFNIFGSIAFSMARHQLKERTFWMAMLDAIKWLPFLVIYFSGISLNCAKALLCHAFSINIEWASTAKEAGPSGFFISIEQMVKQFKWIWMICILIAAMMIYFAVGAPWGWTISPSTDSTATLAIVPLAIQISCSFFLPFFLGLD